MKQSYFGKYGRQLSCLLGLLGLAAPRAQAQVASAIYYTQGSSTAALDAVKSVAATGAGGATTLPAGATALSQPTDIVVDRAGGYLYVADQYVGTGAIWRYNLNGTGQTRVVAPTAGATYNGLALDAANGRLYFTQAGSTASQAALKAVALGGALPATATTVATLPTTFSRPGDLALDAAAGVLYVADQHTAGSIIRVAIGSGAVITLVASVANATYNGLALDAANGRLYFTQGSADATLDALKLVTLSTSAVTTLASGSTNFTQPTDLAFEPGAGQLYLTDQYVNTGPLLRYTVGVSNGTVSVSNRTALVSATAGAAYGGLALALGTAPPVLTASTGAVTAPEQVATAIDPSITVTDPDSPTLTSATVSISSGLVSAEDALSFTASSATTGNIAGSYSVGTGVLTLTSAGGTATLAQWQAALRSVAYRNSSDAPTTAARTISFVVNDGTQNSNVATRTLNVQAVNDAPVNTAPASISTPYNTDVAFTGANTITVSDVDAGSANITTRLTVTNGTLLQNGLGNIVNPYSILGSVSYINNSLLQLAFRPTLGFSGLATVTVLTSDLGNTGTGGALTATSTINITVAAAPALTATVSTTSTSPTSTATIPFAVSFSQSVGTTFTASDVTVTNGTVTSGSLSGSGAGPYAFTVTPNGSGTVSVSLAAGVASDANATVNAASNAVSVQYNQPVTAAPVVTTPANNSISNNRSVTVAGTAPAGSTISIYIGNILAGTTPASAAGAFSYVVPGTAPDGTYTASATAQSSGAAASPSSNINTFTIDGTAPIVALSSTVANSGTTSTTPVSFTATFNEPVANFSAAGLTVTNGTVTSGPTAGANNTYTFQVTPSATGTVTVQVAANAAQDWATNGNTASGTYTFTFAAPTIAVAPASLPDGQQGTAYSQALSATGGTAPYTYALTSGGLPPGLRLTNGTISGTPTASGTFLLRITATDASAAPGPYSGSRSYLLVIAAPAVTGPPVLTSPANSSTTSGTPTYAGTAPAGSTVSIYVAAGSGAYQLVGTTAATSGGGFSLVSPTALASGTYSAYATAQSSGATTSANSNTNTFMVDATAPTVVASNRLSPITATTNATTLTFRVTFSESVTGVDASDFALTTTAGAVSSSGRTVAAISGSVYDVTVSRVTGNGTVRLDLNASGTGITDAVGNAIGGYTGGQTYTIDQMAPTATISTTAANPTSVSPIPFTVTFSEAVTGFMASSIMVTNGVVSSSLTNVSNAYSFSVTPTANGVVMVSVAANVAQDAVGNGNLAAMPLSVTYIAAPAITSLNPATGPVGTQVTITGINLNGATAVRFNNTAASSFMVNSATSITAVVAMGTTTGRVTVTTPGGTATSPYDFVVRVAPITVADTYTTPQNVTLRGNVLTNDIGTNPRAILLTRPTNGTLALNPDGTFSYVPNAGFTGTDSFTYYACDPNLPLLCGNPATVTINVVRVAPIAVADSYTTPAGVTLTGNILTNDIGTNPRAILITRPANGTLTLNPDGTFSYLPNPGFTGTDSFTYYACDPGQPLLCGNPATVTITVTGGGPVTVADTYSTPQGVTLTGNVLTNDIGTNIQAILIIRPTRGTLLLNPNGTFTYQPNAGFTGTDSFIYYACNMGTPLVCGSPATVTITVGAAPNTRNLATIQRNGSATGSGPTVTQSAPALAQEIVLTGSPNPFSEQLHLSFALPTAQAYTLAIYDAQGRLVQQLAHGQAEAGRAQQLDVPTHLYATGLYLVRLTTATSTQLLKLIKQ